MTVAEILLFFAVIYGVYLLLTPVQRKLERWLLRKRKGQGKVYTIKRED